MNIPVNIGLYQDTRRVKKNGRYPVKLRVSFERQTKYYPTHIDLTPDEFIQITEKSNPRGDLKDAKIELMSQEFKAREIVKGLSVFNFSDFEHEFLGPARIKGDIFSYYRSYINQLEKNDQVSTASTYRCSMNNLYEFLEHHLGKKVEAFHFEQLNRSFLEAFEQYMEKDKGHSASTMGMYLRPIKTLFRQAQDKRDIPTELYPFGNGKFQIPSSTNNKRALNRQQLKLLVKAPVDQYEERARDFWMLSFYLNGANMADLLSIRFGVNLLNDEIHFIREKTKRSTKTNQQTIIASLTHESRLIIDKYKTKDSSKGNLVFPVLDLTMNAREKRQAIQNYTRFVNQHLKRLAAKIGLPQEISTMWARHTFATAMLNSNAPVEYISEAIGHKNIKTTQNYLSGFNKEIKEDFANKLTAYVNE